MNVRRDTTETVSLFATQLHEMIVLLYCVECEIRGTD